MLHRGCYVVVFSFFGINRFLALIVFWLQRSTLTKHSIAVGWPNKKREKKKITEIFTTKEKEKLRSKGTRTMFVAEAKWHAFETSFYLKFWFS